MIVNSYKHNHCLNKGKSVHLTKILIEYRRVACIIFNLQLTHFFKTGFIDNSNKLYKPINTFLSERYKDVIKRQVDGMFKSYISNRKNDFKKLVYNSLLTDNEKRALYIINLNKQWFDADNHLARKIFKKVLSKNSFPSMKHINMQLNTKVYSIIDKFSEAEHKVSEAKHKFSETIETTKINKWIRLCTEEKGKFLYIPLLTNTFYDKQKGVLKNGIQLNFKNNMLSTVVLCIEKEVDVEYFGVKTIALDIGLRNLITTSEGDIYSKGFIKKLRYYDNRIQKLTKELQRRGIKPKDSKRYRDMIQCAKEFIKNESNRVINQIVKKHKPKEIVIENLNFKGQNLGKQMNRLVGNFGLGTVNNKLESISKEKGITIKKVNPAYTSMQCSSCGFIHNLNRKKEDFKCLFCGLKSHADINSTKNILRRSYDKRIEVYTNKTKIIQFLISDFVANQRFCDSSLSSAWFMDNKFKPYYLSAVSYMAI